jgi:hypothetical protein
MLIREMVAVHSEIHTKQFNGQNIEFLKINAVTHMITTKL